MTSLRRGHSLFWHETHILLQFLLFAGFTTTKMSRCGSSIYVPNNMCGVCFEALMSNLTWLFCGHSWTEIFINQCVTFTEFVKAVQSEKIVLTLIVGFIVNLSLIVIIYSSYTAGILIQPSFRLKSPKIIFCFFCFFCLGGSEILKKTKNKKNKKNKKIRDLPP